MKMNKLVGRGDPDAPQKLTLQELKEKILSVDLNNLNNFDNILIIAHINPDPDTLGSCLGLKQIFNKLNKTAYIVCDTKVNEKICGYFDISPEIDLKYVESSGFAPDYIICVDAAAVNQIGKYGEYYSEDIAQNKIDIVIDHHYTNSFYGKETYLDDKAAATGEIIFDLAKEINPEILKDKIFAKNIYCAIICDTGSFRYSSTTAKTMSIASELIATGFDFAKLNRLIYQEKTMTQIAIERLAYNSVKLCSNGRIAFITITKDMKKAAGLEGIELDGLNEIPRSIEGVEVGVTIREAETETEEQRKFYISFRSNDYVNVAEIAGSFGGGGHVRAAGCTYETESGVDALEKEIIEKMEKVL